MKFNSAMSRNPGISNAGAIDSSINPMQSGHNDSTYKSYLTLSSDPADAASTVSKQTVLMNRIVLEADIFKRNPKKSFNVFCEIYLRFVFAK